MEEFIDIMADCFFTEYEENIAYDKAEKAIADHDKQIRSEVIEDFIKLCDKHCHFYEDKHPRNGYVLNRATLLGIAEQMKGEQNEAK